jgi:hypothetical protein
VALIPISRCPRIAATLLRQVWPLIVIETGGLTIRPHFGCGRERVSADSRNIVGRRIDNDPFDDLPHHGKGCPDR